MKIPDKKIPSKLSTEPQTLKGITLYTICLPEDFSVVAECIRGFKAGEYGAITNLHFDYLYEEGDNCLILRGDRLESPFEVKARIAAAQAEIDYDKQRFLEIKKKLLTEHGVDPDSL